MSDGGRAEAGEVQFFHGAVRGVEQDVATNPDGRVLEEGAHRRPGVGLDGPWLREAQGLDADLNVLSGGLNGGAGSVY